MATKLKNFSRAWYMKGLAYFLTAAIAAGVLLYMEDRQVGELSDISVKSYEDSYTVRAYFGQYGVAAGRLSSINPEQLDINNKKYFQLEEETNEEEKEEEVEVEVTEQKETEEVEAPAQKEREEARNDIAAAATDTEAFETALTEVTEEEYETDFGRTDFPADTATESYATVTESYDTAVYLTIGIENQTIAEEVIDELRKFYFVWWNENGYVHLKINHDEYGSLYYQSVYDVDTSKGIDLSYRNFLAEHPDIQKQVLSGVLCAEQYAYNDARDILSRGEKSVGLVYDIVEEETPELAEKYKALPIYVRIEKGQITDSSVLSLIGMSIDYDFSNTNKICFLAMSDAYYNSVAADWQLRKTETSNVMNAILLGITGIGILFLYLAIVTGRRPEEEGVFLNSIDRIWSEVQWLLGVSFGAGCISFCLEVVSGLESFPHQNYLVFVLLIVLMGMALLLLLLSQIRLLKAHKWLDSFLCVRIVKKHWSWIKKGCGMLKETWKRGKLSKRALIWAVVLPLACMTWIGVPFVIAFLIYMIYKHMGNFLMICEGAEKIRGGQLSYHIALNNTSGELLKLAENINEISQGLENAVSSELRSERLKTELISNVSHDLKTPLTSIVTYVDLLKQENIENETAKEYIEVIDRKAQRLTVLTNDLFEAAKASSGAMPVNLETVDLNALVRQALGEFDEKLERAELNIRLTLPEAPSYVRADGRLAWRVLDNLLGNVVKYAQTGSRVYIEVKEMEHTFAFVIKNISAVELNIPSDELMERFKRGDESRNSEGSGLGLNIANSLIALQHGSFRISIDGDLFKAEFELPKSEKTV